MNLARYRQKCRNVFMESTHFYCRFLMRLKFSRQIFEKSATIKFYQNPSSGSRVVPCWHTDGQKDITQLTVAFRNFANASKKEKTCVHVAITADRNVMQKEAEKKRKYSSLCIDTENVERKIYENTSSNWCRRNSNKTLKEIFGNHIRKTFSRFTAKIVIIGTSHIIRKVLQSEN